MKAFSFKSNKSVMRVLKEPVIKKKRLNFDRLLYFIIILILLVLLLRYVFAKTATIKANGQVLMNKVDVNFTHDIRLLKFNIQEGDTVTKNQKIFTYIEDQLDNNSSVFLANQKTTQDNAKKVLELKFKIKNKRLKVNMLNNKLKILTQEKERISKLVLLDVYTVNKLSEATLKVDNLNAEIIASKSELLLLVEQLKYIQGLKNTIDSYYSNVNSNQVYSSYYTPIDGVIGQIPKNENETCYRTESVLTIHDPENVYIIGYFDLNELKNIELNDEVTIEFPDNTKSKGIINKYYVSTYALPEEFQKTYEPTERSIVVEILPLNPEEITKWTKYHKLNISIVKYKYNFNNI